MSIRELSPGTGLGGNLRPQIDIVAVHGLNPLGKEDHAVNTWQSPSGHLWLRDALPLKLPTARIFLYKYNSSPIFGADKDRFIYQANDLLERVLMKRDDNQDPSLPILFIGHSLGGILIKQALVNAQANTKYEDIHDSTFGLVFFGTPHAGPSNDAKIRFGKAVVSIANSMPGKTSNDFMEALTKGSLFSDILQESWRHQLEQYQIVSFYEGIGNIVPRDSAVIGLSGGRETQLKINATHSDMCRFDATQETGQDDYELVEYNINRLCRKALAQGNGDDALQQMLNALPVIM